MAFCKFSSSYVIADKTVIDNIFINDFLPYAPDLAIKVYLLGLSKCNNATAPDNNIENFANVLNVSIEDVEKAFLYWQEQGLVQVLSTKPIEIRYMPITNNLGSVKKFKVDKYAEFNVQMQEILCGRMLTPTEYAEYYNLIENQHIEPEALIMITKYCADLKGDSIRYPYIITIAKNWINEGVRTTLDVENKIKELGILDDKVIFILNALGTKRKPQLEDIQMLNTWLQDLDFAYNVILYVAKRVALKKKGDMLALNNQIMKYYEMKLNSICEIDNYEENVSNLYSIAKAVVKNLGLYYEDLSKIVETYVVKWQQQGYEETTLTQIADYSFKNSVRTLDDFDKIVQKLYKLGITSKEALKEYLTDMAITDSKILEILEKLGIKRNVNSFDRTYYKTWTENWNFNEDLLNYAISLSVGKTNAMQYLNKILSNWKSQNISTLEQAQKSSSATKDQSSTEQNISVEKLQSLFGNLEYLDV